ncbi:MAG: hypothetical protein A3E82_02745 [Gammaproteobacteria bacterium RIFCSPHIGHO2_12_FULL_38_11]|nr:MAG: hypothetical protein A3E82_02745 [Gammaproteobacteria bacterium RIFCSPHIGHO2_12_FULL_38_11]
MRQEAATQTDWNSVEQALLVRANQTAILQEEISELFDAAKLLQEEINQRDEKIAILTEKNASHLFALKEQASLNETEKLMLLSIQKPEIEQHKMLLNFYENARQLNIEEPLYILLQKIFPKHLFFSEMPDASDQDLLAFKLQLAALSSASIFNLQLLQQQMSEHEQHGLLGELMQKGLISSDHSFVPPHLLREITAIPSPAPHDEKHAAQLIAKLKINNAVLTNDIRQLKQIMRTGETANKAIKEACEQKLQADRNNQMLQTKISRLNQQLEQYRKRQKFFPATTPCNAHTAPTSDRSNIL